MSSRKWLKVQVSISMELRSCERHRVQCLLYPWILFSLLDEIPALTQVLGRSGLPVVDRPVFSHCLTLGEGVVREGPGIPVRRFNIDRDALPAHSIGFQFRTELEALRFFEHGRMTLACLKGLRHPLSWVHLIRAMLGVKRILGTQGWERSSQRELITKTIFTLRAAVAGLNGLGALDTFSDDLLQELPDGVIRLHINGVGDDLGRIQVRQGRFNWLQGNDAGVGREVDFRFGSLAIAWSSVANLTDNLAAVGKGEIGLRGYVPLADGFNHMLDRLQMFVATT